MKCKICNNKSAVFDHSEVLHKHRVAFFLCAECGFMQTEDPYWLEESYSRTITRSDIGMISRNMSMAEASKKLILTCFNPAGKFLDYGGGYGIFVRLMRDAGFDYYRHDPLCENLFSVGFEARPDETYDMLTSWEVFEHMVDPLSEIEQMLSFSANIFFSTHLLPSHPDPLGKWWYYGLEHGQHVSFFSLDSLRIIARKFGLIVHYSNGFLHWMGRKPVSPLLVKITFSPQFSWIRKILSKKAPRSLLQKDFTSVVGIDME